MGWYRHWNKFSLLAAGRPTRGVHIEKQNVRVVDFVDIRHHNLSLIADLSSGINSFYCQIYIVKPAFLAYFTSGNPNFSEILK